MRGVGDPNYRRLGNRLVGRRDRAGYTCGAGGMRQPVDPNIGCHRSCEAGRYDGFDVVRDSVAIPHAVDDMTAMVLRFCEFQKACAE